MRSVTSEFMAAKFIGKFFALLIAFDRINHSFFLDIPYSFDVLTLLVYLLFCFGLSFSLLYCFFFISFFHSLIILVPRPAYVLFSSLAFLMTVEVVI